MRLFKKRKELIEFIALEIHEGDWCGGYQIGVVLSQGENFCETFQ